MYSYEGCSKSFAPNNNSCNYELLNSVCLWPSHSILFFQKFEFSHCSQYVFQSQLNITDKNPTFKHQYINEFFTFEKNVQQEIHQHMQNVNREDFPSYSLITHWAADFLQRPATFRMACEGNL